MIGDGTLLSSSIACETSRNRKVRVGVIGCGSVSNMYLPHLSRSPFVKPVSVCDIRPERAESQGIKYHVANRYRNIDRMLSGAPFDLMVNLTNMQEHGRLNRQALLAGRHVWSEKPMADIYAEGRALLDLARSKGLRIRGRQLSSTVPSLPSWHAPSGREDLAGLPQLTRSTVIQGPHVRRSSMRRGRNLPDLGVYNFATLS